MSADVAIVGYGRTPYSRAKPGEPVYTVDEYIAWAAELALDKAGMSKNDFDGQGLGVSHAEVAHTVNWSAATAENLGISPQVLLRADQGGASAAAMLIRAAAMIRAGVVDRVLVVLQRYMHEHRVTPEQLGKIAVSTRYHASLHPGAIYRKPITLEEYLGSRMLTDPIRLLDCVPIVNGGLAYIVTSAATARSLTDRPVYLLGHGEANNYYHGARSFPDITHTGFTVAAPQAMQMAGVTHKQIDFLEPYDDFPFIAMMTIEDHGFCKKGEGGRFVEEHNLHFDGDFPLSTDGGQLSGGQPGGAIGGFMPLVEAVAQLRGEAEGRQVPGATIGAACGFGGIPYGRPGRSCVSIILGPEV